jgi:hypothetical protein
LRLLKRLGAEKIRGKTTSFGLFYCAYCRKKAKKRLDSGKTAMSCGCATNRLRTGRGIKHGHCSGKSSKIYNVWGGMKQACYNENSPRYQTAGIHGLKVCDKWVNDFMSFKRWAVSNGHNGRSELIRLDRNIGFSPKNCKIVSRSQGYRLRSRGKLSLVSAREIRQIYMNTNHTYSDIAEFYEVSEATIGAVISHKTWKEVK